MDLEEKQKNSKTIYDGRIISVKLDEVTLPDGSTSSREYVCHRGGASVLAVDGEGYIYLVRQFRYPYREVIDEIPAGKLEAGEEPIETARRELEEETGLIAEKIEELGLLYPTPGYTNEKLYVFLATGLKKSRQCLDEGEFLNVERIKFSDALEKVLTGQFHDAKTCYGILKTALLSDILF